MFGNSLGGSAHPALCTHPGIPQLMPIRAGGLCPIEYGYLTQIHSMQPATPHEFGTNPPQIVTYIL